jgi:two-component system, OmpR family, sensor histidine kinase ChvG
MSSRPARKAGWLPSLFGRVGVRLLVVNLVVLLVPVVGLEFARIYERQLLASLERDMKNQATLVRAHLEEALRDGDDFTRAATREEGILERAAKTTRTRIRVLDQAGLTVADSHKSGPPEGEELAAPSMLPEIDSGTRARDEGPKWPDVPDRPEVKDARVGTPSTITRVRGRAPAVLLFMAEPVRQAGGVAGVVYVTRSTQPVLVELYRIRTGLLQLLGVALAITAGVTLALAFSITRPLVRLSGAARRVAAGELGVPIPVSGSGEIQDLAVAFSSMKERLLLRLRFAREFAADVAHELKSPLTSIRGAAELLAEGAFDDPEARQRFLKNIQLDVDRLDKLATRLLVLGRLEASEAPMAPVDVAALARRVAERAALPEKPVEVRGPASVVVPGREDDLETAVANLVENAVRHSPAGQPVIVTVEGRSQGAEVRIADRGAGISPANLEKIFERFFTTEAERGGTGLGLAIVRAVANAHGGEITCESTAGEGSSFTMTLGFRPVRPSTRAH